VYRYRDASGNWIYTDRQPGAAAQAQQVTVHPEPKSPRTVIERVADHDHIELRAINECVCSVEFELRVLGAPGAAPGAESVYHEVLEPRSERTLYRAEGEAGAALHYKWKAVRGRPGARHAASEPYRAPFALGTSFLITQAYPMLTTHTTPDSYYAVDLALPEGTAVYAARDGTVIDTRYDAYQGAPSPALYDRANGISILHEDGTVAIYGHLRQNSVRVEPGQHVRRGEYIADSGNTGFSSGPHLHFGVVRNAGLRAESVPVKFAGPGGFPITPERGAMLTAY